MNHIIFLMRVYLRLTQANAMVIADLYKTIKSIVGVFEENGRLVPKHRGGVHCPIVSTFKG